MGGMSHGPCRPFAFPRLLCSRKVLRDIRASGDKPVYRIWLILESDKLLMP